MRDGHVEAFEPGEAKRRGSLPGTLIGVALLGSIGPALIFLGINPYSEKAIQGAIILVTVLLDALSTRRMKALATH